MRRLAWTVLLLVTLSVDYRSFTLNVDLGDIKVTETTDAFVAGHVCKYLGLTGHLDWLPAPYVVEIHIPTGEGTWIPDPTRRITGMLARC